MNLDYLDLYYCHRYDESTDLEETLRGMSDLVAQGKKQNSRKTAEIKAFDDIGYRQMLFLFVCDFEVVRKRRDA